MCTRYGYCWNLVLLGVYVDRRFDRKHGVDTSGAITLGELAIESDSLECGELYDPFPVRSIKRLMNRLPAIDHREHTFVDFGSGKGR